MPMTSQEMIRLLNKLKNHSTEKTVIVPYHSKDLKKGLEQAILK
mgnify:CR=1 FL=1